LCGIVLIDSLTDITRQQIGKRGIKVYTGIGRLLRKGDLNGDGLINKFELEKSLVDFRVNIPQGVSYLFILHRVEYK